MENLFSYGTLQEENVQLENYNRILEGSDDILKNHCLKNIEIKDESVIRKSNKNIHPIIYYTGNEEDEIRGKVFKITSDELIKTDNYEVSDYHRVEVTLKSGIKSWVYVGISKPYEDYQTDEEPAPITDKDDKQIKPILR